jgi:hypothetical protein
MNEPWCPLRVGAAILWSGTQQQFEDQDVRHKIAWGQALSACSMIGSAEKLPACQELHRGNMESHISWLCIASSEKPKVQRFRYASDRRLAVAWFLDFAWHQWIESTGMHSGREN